MNIAYMALYGEGTDLLGYVLLQNMQLARATLDVELEHMGLGALLAIAEGVEAALDLSFTSPPNSRRWDGTSSGNSSFANSSEPDIPERLALMSATLSRWRMPCTS